MRTFLVLVVGLSGCASTTTLASSAVAPNRYQLQASGYLGCRAVDISITEYVADSSGSSSWVAQCGEQTFVCGGGPGGTVHCTAVRTEAIVAGCASGRPSISWPSISTSFRSR